ncbi:MAG: hypothetical protein HY049_00785 [Acidobacteria bacterium]|nr:hypothetical protein [Acidobacteriota bacterium]
MSRVVVTGLHVACAAGEGTSALEAALVKGEPLGGRVARMAGFDPERALKGGAARRMSAESRVVTASFLAAAADAGCAARPVPPERTGTFLGSAFGSLSVTCDYLRGILQDGMAAASPALFAESLASAPLGHATMALDARGPSFGFTSGDVSMIAALDEARRAIESGRIDRAYVAAFELMPDVLIELFSRLAVRGGRPLHAGEGVATLVLEGEETARETGAKVRGAVSGTALAGDPAASPTDWSHDPRAWGAPCDRALAQAAAAEGSLPPLAAIVIQAPPSPAARAERSALDGILTARGRAEIVDVHRVVGDFAGAGGIAIAAAVILARRRGGHVLVSAGSWGGATGAAVISPSGA